jgi:hypothetical protein
MSFFKYAGVLAALGICSACAALRQAQGDMGVAPSTASLNGTYIGRTLWVNGRPVTAARLNPAPRYATILPEGSTKSKYYEYIINTYGTYATIFNYPASDKQIGSIYGDGGQGCTNVLYGYGKEIFWNVGGYNLIREYKVPQTYIRTLSVSDDSLGAPSSCAMDTRGDLAVGILYGPGGGDIVFFYNANPIGTVIATPLAREYFDGYDDKGNLFFDGFTPASNFGLFEIPKGSGEVKAITTSNGVGFPGSVQWDGTYMTVTDQSNNEIYQYTIGGTKATLKGTVTLSGAGDCAQTWIATGVVYCGDYFNNDGEVYKYPAGGSAIAILTGNFDGPLGVVAAAK